MNLEELRSEHQQDAGRHVLITEVTRMTHGDVCVAGIDIHTGSMVRPLRSKGENWEEIKWANERYLAPGNLVSLAAATTGHPAYPHATEDFRVANIALVTTISAAELHSICLETADASIESLFDNQLVDGKYVPANTQCRSLGAVIVSADMLKAQAPFDKPQISYKDDHGVWHNFTATELDAKNAGDADAAAEALSSRLAKNGGEMAVLRLGLARAWKGPDQEYDPPRCYVQLNGLILPA